MYLKLTLPARVSLLALSLLAALLTGCGPSAEKKQATVENTPKLLASLMNKGSDIVELHPEQPLIVNSSNKSERWWHVTLGKNSRKSATLEHYDNQRQHSLTFTQQGTYLLTVTSRSDEKTLNQMQRQLTIVIK